MPYTYTDSAGRLHYLHAKRTVRPDGTHHVSFYFARALKPAEALDAVPPGYSVWESPVTGRPYLRRASRTRVDLRE